MDYSKNWLSVCRAENLPENHRSRVIIHDGQWYIAEYANIDQLRDFAAAVGGFSWTLDHVDTLEHRRIGSKWERCEPYQIEYYALSHRFTEPECHWWYGCGYFKGMWCKLFWDVSEIPAGAYPIMGFSNGSLVHCYATNDGETIGIYRPNPNAKAVYRPLPLAAHFAYTRKHGDLGPCDSGVDGAFAVCA